ncbi:hypothetical protein JCM16106_16940 [Hydrogenophilus islandicus]
MAADHESQGNGGERAPDWGELGQLLDLFLRGLPAAASRTTEKKAAPPRPSRLSLAIEHLTRITGGSRDEQSPEQQERLVFDVEVVQHAVRWRAWLTRPYKRDPRRLIQGTAVSWDSRYPLAGLEERLTLADLYGLLFAGDAYAGAHYRISPLWLGTAFAAIVQSGRAFWGDHTFGVPLTWSPETPVLGWQWREDARGRFVGVYRVPEEIASAHLITNTWPWHYLLPRERRVGACALPEGVTWAQFAALQNLPPIAPDEVERFARLWSERLPSALPPPTVVARHEVTDSPRFILRLVRLPSGERQIEPQVRYGPVTVYADHTLSHSFGEAVVTVRERQRPREQNWFERVALWADAKMAGEPYRALQPKWSAARWLEERERLAATFAEFAPEIEVAPDFWPEVTEASFGELTLQPIADDPDWFEWQGNIRLDDDVAVPVEEIAAEVFARYGAEGWPEEIVVDLPGQRDRCACVPLKPIEPVLRVALELLNREPNRKGRARVSRYDLTLLQALPEALWPERPPAFAAMIDELRAHNGPLPVTVPESLTAALRPYQEVGVAWLQFWRRHRLHGLLADDMGLGKTLQALAHLEIDRVAGRLDAPALVVAPTSLIGNWLREAARFAPQLRVVAWHGNDRAALADALPSHHLVITSYALLWRDIDRLKTQRWSVVILDEAQAIKNPRARVAQSVRQLHAAQRLCLTGTPMENHLGELWALFDFLMPGFLGRWEVFQRLYRTPIEKHGDWARLDYLRHRIRPFLLRRTKAEVAEELPPKSEIVETLTLGERQAKVYEAIRVAMEARVRQALAQKGLAKSQITVLDALLKLRQTCCDPSLLDTPQARRVQESAKLDWLRETLPELVEEGRKVLIFSQFVKLLERVETLLKELAIPYAMLTGQTRQRDEVVARFQRGEMPVFLISLKAGGTGLNLTEADTVILLDPWWNPAVEEQAIDRAHRIGQEKPVFIYKLICANTVEEQILKLQAQKRALATATYEGEGAAGFSLTEAEIAALFAVSPV